MKTTKIRLLATMITLAAVTTITTFSAQAQRRSTGRETSESAAKKSDESRKRIVQEKSTFKDYDKVQRTPQNSNVTKNKSIQRQPAPTVTQNQKRNNDKSTAARNAGSNTSKSVRNGSAPKSWDNFKEQSNFRNSRTTNSNSEKSRKKVVANNGNTASRPSTVAVDRRSNSTSGAVSRRETSVNTKNREIYKLNSNDRRYQPNTNYRGSNKTWSEKYRPSKMNYNHNSKKFYNNYNYNYYSHWDHRWENYCWNQNSWVDYYYGYNPYSYRYHKNYYHHNYYGHVIRQFVFAPQVFIHNHNRYYNYNGHFFRYHRGIGYVLVDVPFGITFDYLPSNYEQVYINGYLYFRVGNLFFEYSNYGFQLVHYPERYYAYNNDYRNEGFYFGDNY